MLIVDSPFPPYAPLDVDVFVKPMVGDMKTADAIENISYGKTPAKQYVWKGGRLPHRDNDLPAMVWTDGFYMFYTQGVHHRISGPSSILDKGIVGKTLTGSFSLYGRTVTYEDFVEIHRVAIKYGLPLWMVALGFNYGINFEGNEMGEFTAGALNALGEKGHFMPIDWLLTLWGINVKGLNLTFLHESGTQTFLGKITDVVEYEKKIYLSHLASSLVEVTEAV